MFGVFSAASKVVTGALMYRNFLVNLADFVQNALPTLPSKS